MKSTKQLSTLKEDLIVQAAKLAREYGQDPNGRIPHAVMNRLEQLSDSNVTIGYGSDSDQFEDYYDDHPAWWPYKRPTTGTRFRIFIPGDAPQHDRDRVGMFMAAVGATPVGVFSNDEEDSYDHRGRDTYHYVLPNDSPAVGGAKREYTRLME